jgi:putative redox protein
MGATFRATLEQVQDSTSKATVRSHSVLVDRTVAKGGSDLGPAGGEYLVVALGGCFTSHLLAAIRARNAPMSKIRVQATGTLDGVPERFQMFTLDIGAECEDAEVARKLIAIAARACQVVNTLSQVGPIAITYQGQPMDLARPAAD